MAMLEGTPGAFDERTLGRDSSGPASEFRLSPGELAYGDVSGTDAADWYRLSLPGPGVYRLVLSADSANSPAAGSGWRSGGGLVLMFGSSDGEILWSHGTPAVFPPYTLDACVAFVDSGETAAASLFAMVRPSFSQGAIDYVLAFEWQPLAAAGQTVAGTEGLDWLTGGSGNDTLRAASGSDMLRGGPGDDLLDGGPALDVALYHDATSAIVADLGAGRVTGGSGNDTLVDIESIEGSRYDDRLIGSADADYFSGNRGDDHMSGGPGDDFMDGGEGNDTFDGGPGVDLAHYMLTRAGYTLTKTSGGWGISDALGDEGTDTLVDVERLSFADTWLALDVTPDGHAMQAAQVIYTLFGRHGLHPQVVGIALAMLDGGMSFAALLRAALESQYYEASAGSRSNRDFVKLVWTSVVGAAPSEADLGAWTALLDSGTYTQFSLAELASRHPLVTGSATLVGIAEHGIEYAPWQG